MAYILKNFIDIFGGRNTEAYQIISSYTIDVEKREASVTLKTFVSDRTRKEGYRYISTVKKDFTGWEYARLFGEHSEIPILTVREGDNLLAIYNALEATPEFELNANRTRIYEDLIKDIPNEILDPIPDPTGATTFVITEEMTDTVVTTMGDSYPDGWNGNVEAKITNVNTGEVYVVLVGPEAGSSSEDINFQLPQGTYGVYMDGSAYSWTEENSMIIFTAGVTLLEIPQGSFPAEPGLYYGQTAGGEGEGGEGEGGEGEPIFGCTDPNAINYNPDATVEDGSCQYGEGEGEGEG